MGKKKMVNEETELYWQKLVEVFFQFCREKFGSPPSFIRSAPKDMRELIEVIKSRAVKSGVEWTEQEAIKRWRCFLEYAYTDDWLSRNFLLSNLVRQQDKIFFGTITPKNNGRIGQTSGGDRKRITKSSGAEQLIGLLKDKLVTGTPEKPDFGRE